MQRTWVDSHLLSDAVVACCVGLADMGWWPFIVCRLVAPSLLLWKYEPSKDRVTSHQLFAVFTHFLIKWAWQMWVDAHLLPTILWLHPFVIMWAQHWWVCKSYLILCLLFLWLHTSNRWVWWTWFDSHLLSSIMYGHGLIPIFCPSSGEHGLIPICRSPFGLVSELNGHGLIPICCPPSGEHGLIPICCSPFGPN